MAPIPLASSRTRCCQRRRCAGACCPRRRFERATARLRCPSLCHRFAALRMPSEPLDPHPPIAGFVPSRSSIKVDATAFVAGVAAWPIAVPERRRWPSPASESPTNARGTMHTCDAPSALKKVVRRRAVCDAGEARHVQWDTPLHSTLLVDSMVCFWYVLE